jgi:hypothetical protein
LYSFFAAKTPKLTNFLALSLRVLFIKRANKTSRILLAQVSVVALLSSNHYYTI